MPNNAPPNPVTFNWFAWKDQFPEFAALPQPRAQMFFDQATLYCANSYQSAAFAAGVLEQLLNLLTAHVAWLFSPKDVNGAPSAGGAGQVPSSIVGRISSASEGSVSVSSEWSGGSGSPSQAWFLQSPYGAAFWQATAQFRAFRYSPRPTVVVDSVYPFVPTRQWR